MDHENLPKPDMDPAPLTVTWVITDDQEMVDRLANQLNIKVVVPMSDMVSYPSSVPMLPNGHELNITQMHRVRRNAETLKKRRTEQTEHELWWTLYNEALQDEIRGWTDRDRLFVPEFPHQHPDRAFVERVLSLYPTVTPYLIHGIVLAVEGRVSIIKNKGVFEEEGDEGTLLRGRGESRDA